MKTFLIIIGVLVFLVLLFYGNLLVSLLSSIKSGKRRVIALIASNTDPQVLDIRFNVNNGGQILINSISIDKRLAETLEAKAPSGFTETQYSVPDEKDFEPDLSVLLDQHDESQITENMIREETRKQYEEELRVFDESRSTTIRWTGSFTIEKGKRNILSIPVKSSGPAKGRIYFSYELRSGLLKVSEGCSVEINRD